MRGSKPGERRGGRQKGTPNKATRTMEETLAKLNCDPIEGMALIASGKIPCGTCRGKLRTKVKAQDGTFFDRTCESCYGSGYEKVTPDLRGRMYAELAQYTLPKRKAIEITGAGGGPVDNRLTVEFVKP